MPAYAGELRHRGEHSLELVAVWLHHMRAGQAAAVVPILTGSFHPFMVNGETPSSDPTIAAVLDVLRAAMAGRRTLIVASGDLAHVGPAFGGAPLDGAARRVLRRADDELIAAMRAGDAGQFFGAIRQVQNANNVCGVAPLYLTLRLLGESRGERGRLRSSVRRMRKTPRWSRWQGWCSRGGRQKAALRAWRQVVAIFKVDEAIAQPALGEDVARVAGIRLDLLAQIGDVEAQEMIVVDVLVPPDFGEQRLVRHTQPAFWMRW
jgi:hypothetical protein